MRCVCQFCTEYIQTDEPFFPATLEGNKERDEWWKEWGETCDAWLAKHKCGTFDGDGVENTKVWSQFIDEKDDLLIDD